MIRGAKDTCIDDTGAVLSQILQIKTPAAQLQVNVR